MIDYDRLQQNKTTVDIVLSYDLERLCKENDVRRLQWWNEIRQRKHL